MQALYYNKNKINDFDLSSDYYVIVVAFRYSLLHVFILYFFHSQNGEISLLKSQLKESHGDQTTKGHEMLALRTQLREAQAMADKKHKEVRALQEQVINQRNCSPHTSL
jgi:hypothetical protein